MKYDEVLNVCGAVCPVPAIKTVQQLGKMKPGTVLKVIVDYRPATEATPRYVSKTKHKFLGMEDDEESGGWALYFEAVK
ncbi:MAG: sulfurtransferase TusA family protein [Candidatus Thorarchaeota archaeon]